MIRTDYNLRLRKTSITVGNCNIHVTETKKNQFTLTINAVTGSTQVELLFVKGVLNEKMETALTVIPFQPDPEKGPFAMRPDVSTIARTPRPPTPFTDL